MVKMVGAALCAFLLFAGAAAGQDPSLTLVDATVTLSSGEPTASDAMLLEGRDLTTQQMTADLVVQELNVPSGPVDVTVTATQLDDGDEQTRRWLLTVDASGLEGEVDQQRYIGFALGDLSVTKAYQLISAPKGEFHWTVGPLENDIALKPGEVIKLDVSVTGRPASHVLMAQAKFVQDGSKQLIGAGWKLCPYEGECAANQSFSFHADSANSLKLVPDGLVVGKYTGVVIVGAKEDPEGKTLTFTLYGTAWWLQAGGVVVILFGVALAWISTTWAQNRINRAELTRPLVVLGNKAGALGARLDAMTAPIDKHLAKTRAALASLSTATLITEFDDQGILPPPFPLPRAAGDAQLEAYKAALADRVGRMQILEVVIGRGFEELAFQAGDKSAADIERAAHAIDATSASAKTAEEAATAVAEALAPLTAAVAEGVVAGAATPTLAELALEVRQTSILIWAVFGLLATALGAYAVIVTNPGFGVWSDFLLCLFWGFGLPATAEQAKQATLSTVGTALSVPVPKSS